MDAFGFGFRRTRQRVIFGSGATLCKSAPYENVYDHAVFCVHADQTATLTSSRHRFEDRAVVNEKHTWISHEQLKTRNALRDQTLELRQPFIGKVRYDQMKSIIERCFALGF